MLLAVFAGPVSAQPASTPLTAPATQLTGAQANVAGRVSAFVFPITALTFPSSDLSFPIADIGGKAQALQVKETPTEIRISLAADVLFDFDKASLKKEAVAALTNVASMIREHAGLPVRIEGYTDAKGTDSYNQRLSEQRANSVRAWLVTKGRLKATKFATRGFGAKNPVAPNTKPDGSDDPDGRQKNRRVEIVIEKG
jgi:outer membrane protein OmpA-like peptidoglycan-associated protein